MNGSQSALEDESSSMEETLFGARAVDQGTLEHKVAIKAEKEIYSQANKDDLHRLEKTDLEKEKTEYQLKRAQDQFKTSMTNRADISDRIKELENKISCLNDDILDISTRMRERTKQIEALSNSNVDVIEIQRPNESDRQFLIRTGKITPFSNVPGIERIGSNAEFETNTVLDGTAVVQKITAQHLRTPGFKDQTNEKPLESSRQSSGAGSASGNESSDQSSKILGKKRKTVSESDDDFIPESHNTSKKPRIRRATKDPTTPSETTDAGDTVKGDLKKNRTLAVHLARLDDGDEKMYQKRVKKWISDRRDAREKARKYVDTGELLEEWHMPHPVHADLVYSGGLKLPGDIHPSLFDYQKICVQWLWELYCQNVGGILGDEMGLGKTIQVIAFIAGLHHSDMLDKPCIIVAPGAVLKQWASQFHTWWPCLRVAILHSSGSGMLVAGSDRDEDSESDDETNIPRANKTSKAAAKKIVDRVFRDGHVLVTTYEGLTTYGSIVSNQEWALAVLDEGHRIRNPDAKVTLTCKHLKTAHRLILSGTPVQNNLIELWSIFDFVYPGRLGTLPVFREQFEVPIRIGGYKSATNLQVQMATQCASVLRDMIGPYLLRRLKLDVMRDLPPKYEKVVFCRLTKLQREKYIEYLKSPEVERILAGEYKSLGGISVLRKICCHPDLVDRPFLQGEPGYEYGHSSKSGKMQITKKMLILWKEQGHRALLFSQSVQILDILEKDIRSYKEFKYRRMDGSTPIALRQGLVDEFNQDETIDVFLMTTRVGGLGLNLTSADRARERAWRIGQKKSVSIFRLVAAGTIEEKMYNRQLFKQHLSQKVLTDAAQRRVFESESLRDLFKFDSGTIDGTTTGAIFQGAERFYSNTHSRSLDSSKTGHVVPTKLTDIAGIAGLQDYKVEENQHNSETHESGEKQFIEQIFGHAGVISTLEHEEAVGRIQKPLSGAEKYAADVAQAAAERLKESVRAAQSVALGTPTWTGRSGSAGKHNLMKSTNVDSTPRPARNTRDKRPLAKQMLEMFEKAGGKISTPDIKLWCAERSIDKRDPEKAREMRIRLREIAKLNKSTHEWELKQSITKN